MAMKLKTVEVNGKQYAMLDEQGLPIYVHDDGKEVGFDAPGTNSRIAGLNREAMQHREAKETAENRLKHFHGIEDPDAARKALETVSGLKAGDLKKAEEVEEIRKAAQRAAEEQVRQTAQQSAQRISELEKERDGFRDSLYDEKVGGAFARSEFISKRTTVHPDMLRDTFGKHFKVEDGKIVPYGADGNKIFSKVRGGEVADFEEGIQYLIDGYAHKGNILRGTGASGTGAQHQHGNQQQVNGRPTMLRSDFERLPPADKSSAVKSHTIVDSAA